MPHLLSCSSWRVGGRDTICPSLLKWDRCCCHPTMFSIVFLLKHHGQLWTWKRCVHVIATRYFFLQLPWLWWYCGNRSRRKLTDMDSFGYFLTLAILEEYSRPRKESRVKLTGILTVSLFKFLENSLRNTSWSPNPGIPIESCQETLCNKAS